jgi:hypothetical protein
MSRCTAVATVASIALASLALAAIPADARGDTRSSPGLEGRRSNRDLGPRRWYGWQVMSADAVAVAAGAGTGLVVDAAGGDPSSVGSAVFAGGYLLGGPTVHVLQGRYGHAAGSLALRVGGPLLFGFIGHHLDTSDTGGSGDDLGESARIGVALGTAAALLLDWSSLSWAPVETPRAARLVPTATAGDGRVALGLAGRF